MDICDEKTKLVINSAFGIDREIKIEDQRSEVRNGYKILLFHPDNE